MKKNLDIKKIASIIIVVLVAIFCIAKFGLQKTINLFFGDDTNETIAVEKGDISEDGQYFDKDNVALYIHTYGKLPSNFVTKKVAEQAGWENGSVEDYLPGKAIGGDYFGNYQDLLPKKSGREYHECDIDTNGKSTRGSKRIIYSNDGLIYYTDDHYETFTLLYGTP